MPRFVWQFTRILLEELLWWTWWLGNMVRYVVPVILLVYVSLNWPLVIAFIIVCVQILPLPSNEVNVVVDDDDDGY